jgi:hypothetical protein
MSIIKVRIKTTPLFHRTVVLSNRSIGSAQQAPDLQIPSLFWLPMGDLARHVFTAQGLTIGTRHSPENVV